MIVASAIKHKGIVFTGKRHCKIIKYLVELGYETPIPNNEQGFIDDNGHFHYRKEALKIAIKCKQIPHTQKRILVSEDLW